MIRRGRGLVVSTAVFGLMLGAVAMSTTATAAPKTTAKGAKQNTLGVQVVRFAPGTAKKTMTDAVAAAGGEVLSDLSKMNRLAVRSDDANFAKKLGANKAVKAIWTDRVIPLSRVDAGGLTGNNDPALGTPGANPIPDPWHDLTSFAGEDAPGVLQWDDDATGNRGAWATTTGDRTVRVAVIDSGVEGSHKELLPNYDNQASANTIPCNLLTRQFGPLGQKDCSSNDTDGHGTWVASRIAGALNGFASNGAAPGVQIVGYKALSTTLGGGLTSWIVDAMVRACDSNVDLINMSLGGYDVPGIDDEDYLMWADATNYCRAKGTAIFASAGNEHVRLNKVNMLIGGVPMTGVGQVDNSDQGIATIVPGDTVANNDLRGLLETPAGVPGVIMVSATNNTNGDPAGVLSYLSQKPTVGLTDQLTYYSNFGSRIDIAAPGGARKYNVPRYDGGLTDILYGGWGQLGALTGNGEICQDPTLANFATFACFKVTGASFGWLQGTSMSSPNATGTAALVLSAHHELQGNPDGLLARLKSTARGGMVNETGPSNPTDTGTSITAGPCTSGYCHLTYYPGGAGNPISYADAYGAGMVNATAAVAP